MSMEKMLKKLQDMDPEERQKIHSMLRDQKKGSPDRKEQVSWMYKGEKPEEEEYLLGRRIDKHIEEEHQPEEDKDAPGAIFAEAVARRADLDMKAKMREDPLFAIKKKEEETRRRLLENPIRMKQLEKLLAENEKMKKKNKNKKKKKKSSSSDSDDEILDKYLAILEQKKSEKPDEPDRKKSRYQDEEDRRHDKHSDDRDGHSKHSKHSKHIDDRDGHSKHSDDRDGQSKHSKHSDDRDGHSRHSRDSRSDLRTSKRRSSESSSGSPQKRRKPDDETRRTKAYGLIVGQKQKHIKSESPGKKSRSPERSRPSDKSRSHHIKQERSRSPHSSRSSRRSRSPHRHSKSTDTSSQARDQRQPTKKLSGDEMARRRAEMLENARWRDEQRDANVKRYKEEDAKEEEAQKKQPLGAGFIKPMMMQHASQSSVEERIKRNMYNIQRTNIDLDKHFTKR